MRYVLLNPGPVNLDERVRKAAIQFDMCHRQKEFLDTLANVKKKLLVIANRNDCYVSILSGSGSLAVESALQTLVSGNVLVINNGPYCQRILDSLHLKIGTNAFSFELEMGQSPDIEEISKILEEKSIDWVVVVHHETASGLLNPLSQICNVAKKRNTKVFVDAVSSFGAHEIDIQTDVVCFNSNKCLESIPGLSIVVWKKNLSRTKHEIPFCLNLFEYVEDKMPNTVNTNAVLALNAALDIYLSEDRKERYRCLAEHVRNIGSRQFDLFLQNHYSNVLTTFVSNKCEEIYKVAKENGFILYPGKIENQFRVANMGFGLSEFDIDRLFLCLEKI